MSVLRMLQCTFALAVLGSQWAHAQQLDISSMKAVPRSGHNACWGDAAGRLKTTCGTTESLSFMVDSAVGKTVAAFIFTDAAPGTMKCQAASLKPQKNNYWAVSALAINQAGDPSIIALPAWKHPFLMYQIDCWVPSGATVYSAEVIKF